MQSSLLQCNESKKKRFQQQFKRNEVKFDKCLH
jgi:hypothetical protein